MAQNQVAGLHDKLVPPAWSLCVEMSFYALLPLLGAAIIALSARAGRLRYPWGTKDRPRPAGVVDRRGDDRGRGGLDRRGPCL